MPYTISPSRSLICRFFHPPVAARAVGAMMQRAAAGRVRRRADGSWSSIHLGNAPEPRRQHPLLAPPLPVAACWWALTRVASSIRYSLLGSLVSSAKIRSQTLAFCPTREALVHALPFAVSLGQFVPLCPGSQHPKHGVDEQAIVLRGPTGIGLLARQHPCNTRPQPVIELVPLRHALCSESIDPKRNQSEPNPNGNPECRLDLASVRERLQAPDVRPGLDMELRQHKATARDGDHRTHRRDDQP